MAEIVRPAWAVRSTFPALVNADRRELIQSELIQSWRGFFAGSADA
jgi:hypothetical protein